MKKSPISLTKGANTAFGAAGVLSNAIGTSVQLRQTITGDGLDVTSGNSNNSALGALTPTGKHLPGYDQIRTCLFPVNPGTTAEQVEAELAKLPDACLYYITSDDVADVLGANQLAGIRSGKSSKSLNDYKAELEVINPSTGAKTGVYRATYFSATAKADVDFRRSKASAAAVPMEQTVAAATPAVAPAPAGATDRPF